MQRDTPFSILCEKAITPKIENPQIESTSKFIFEEPKIENPKIKLTPKLVFGGPENWKPQNLKQPKIKHEDTFMEPVIM